MIKIKPIYVLDGCPIQVFFEFSKTKNLLIFYGWKSLFRKSNDSIVLFVNKKYKKISVYYWNQFFFKKEKVDLDIKTYKSTNINDLNHELSGAITVHKTSIKSLYSNFEIFNPKTAIIKLNKNIKSPFFKKINNGPESFIKTYFIKKNILEPRKIQSINIKKKYDNDEFNNFKKEVIQNQ